MQRVLGLDVGARTIGVAVTDELGLAAHGVLVIDRKGTSRDVARITELVQKYAAELVVVGMPYELDGALGKRAERVQVFIDALAATGIAVDTWDERFSTAEAEEALLLADVSRKKRKDVIDKMAAQVILQGWLNHRSEVRT